VRSRPRGVERLGERLVLTRSRAADLGVLCAFVSPVNLSLRMQERRTDGIALYGSVVLYMVSKQVSEWEK